MIAFTLAYKFIAIYCCSGNIQLKTLLSFFMKKIAAFPYSFACCYVKYKHWEIGASFK